MKSLRGGGVSVRTHAKMPITTGSPLDDALLCFGVALSVVLLYKAWKLFAKLFFTAAVLFILLNGDKWGLVPSGYISEKVPSLEGSRVHELLSGSRAVAYVAKTVLNQGLVRYEPVPAPKTEEDVVAAEVQEVEESGGWQWLQPYWR